MHLHICPQPSTIMAEEYNGGLIWLECYRDYFQTDLLSRPDVPLPSTLQDLSNSPDVSLCLKVCLFVSADWTERD